MNNDLSVLIIGAGPTGLMMACELARHGISFRIIDKNQNPTVSSNATWIQSRTMEIFDHIGIIDRFTRLSNPCHAINLYTNGKSLAQISLTEMDSTYPYIMMLPQSETERLLNERLTELHGKVERPLKLTDVKQIDNKVISTIENSNGYTDEIVSDWLIACDGANSSVREKSGIYFPGEDLPEQFIVADAIIESHMSKDEVHVFFDKGSVFAAFPLGANKYRIMANLNLGIQRKLYTEREVIEMAQERAQGTYYVKSVSWISFFWIHSKLANNMQNNSIFLAGDSAHIHSPALGQGMNTGIQDAYNLAWKLALRIKGKAKSSLLNSYQIERYPVIKEMVNKMESYTKMALFDKNFLKKLNKYSQKLADKNAKFSQKIVAELTQTHIQYTDSPIIDCTNIKKNLIKPGMRAPNVIIHSSSRLYNYFHDTKHHILLFLGLNPSKKTLLQMTEFQKLLHHVHPDLINVYLVSPIPLEESKNVILDVNANIHNQYKVKTQALYIIRPDNYIAYCSNQFKIEEIENLFKRFCNE